MRILQLVGGIVSIGFGVLLCIPALFLAWQAIPFPPSSSPPGSLPRSTRHTDFILSVGSTTITGWQMWALVGGLALGGVLLAILGFHGLSSRDASR
jgi:hypothetical protein